MSEYSKTATQFKDGPLLVEALKEMGFKQVNNHIGNPKPLEGYMGDYRTQDGRGHTKDARLAMKADIIVPRAVIGGSSNDLGFARGTDGKYNAIISNFDQNHAGYNAAWMRKLKAVYAEKGVMQQAQKAGLKFIGKKQVNGKLQMQFLQY